MRDFSIKFDTPTELCYDDFVSIMKFLNRTTFFDSRFPKLVFDSIINARFVSNWKLYNNFDGLNEDEKIYYYLYLGCSSFKDENWFDAFEKLSVVREKLSIWEKPATFIISSPPYPTPERSIGQFIFISDTYWFASKKVNEMADSYFKSGDYSKVIDLYKKVRKYDNGRLFNIYDKALISMLFLAHPEKVTNDLINIGVTYPIISKISDLQNSAYNKWCSSSKPKLTEDEVYATHIECHGLDWVYTAGMKYEGKTINEVLQKDQKDIWECIMSLFNFSVHPTVLLDDRVIKSPEFYQALEVILAKDIASASWEGLSEAINARWDADLYDAEAERDRHNEQLLDDAIRDEERSMDEETDGFWRWNID